MMMSNRMIAVSEFVRRHMLSHFVNDEKKITTVHNGILPELYDEAKTERMKEYYRRELGIGGNEKVVGMVASLTPRKGYSYFIQAAKKVVKDYNNVVFLGVGGGPQHEELEALVKENGLDGKFRFLGVRNDVRDLLYLFDIFVLSSSSEGLPYVILEAMCMNKPIVTTDVGGIPEAIDSGRNGILVKPRDVDGLALNIGELLTNEERAVNMGNEARKTVVESFTVMNMVEKTEKIYIEALG